MLRSATQSSIRASRSNRSVCKQQKRGLRPAGTPPSGDSTRGLHSSGNLPATVALVALTGGVAYTMLSGSKEEISAAQGRPGESNIRSSSEMHGTAKSTGGPAKGSNGHGEGPDAKAKFEDSIRKTRSGAYEGDRDAVGKGSLGSGYKG